jgi:predicted transcriptional regulator
MMKRTFTTLASKLERDNKIIQFYKNVFVSHDTINKYMAMTIGITGAGYFYIQQDMKELKNELKDDMKDLRSDIKDLKDLIIANNQQRK